MGGGSLSRWQPTPVLLPGKSRGWRSLVGCSPWGRLESDTTKRLHFHFSLSHIGEGNGNPLQCSCLENPRDRGAWWADIYGVAQSWTRLKWLSSSLIGRMCEWPGCLVTVICDCIWVGTVFWDWALDLWGLTLQAISIRIELNCKTPHWC